MKPNKAPGNKSPPGIRPFLCLKGKFIKEKESPKLALRKCKVKDKMNKFESMSKSDKALMSRDKDVSKKVNEDKIKRIIELFETGNAPKVVHAPSKIEDASKENKLGKMECVVELLMLSRF